MKNLEAFIAAGIFSGILYVSVLVMFNYHFSFFGMMGVYLLCYLGIKVDLFFHENSRF